MRQLSYNEISNFALFWVRYIGYVVALSLSIFSLAPVWIFNSLPSRALISSLIFLSFSKYRISRAILIHSRCIIRDIREHNFPLKTCYVRTINSVLSNKPQATPVHLPFPVKFAFFNGSVIISMCARFTSNRLYTLYAIPHRVHRFSPDYFIRYRRDKLRITSNIQIINISVAYLPLNCF